MGEILNGKAVARDVLTRVRLESERLANEHGVRPGLATVLVGDNPASRVYVATKKKTCQEVGIRTFSHTLPGDTSEADLLGLIDALNADPEVHGILVQLPLPQGFSDKRVLARLSPDKDVDGLHPMNQGRLLAGEPGLRPCTPLGVMELIDHSGTDLKGKRAVVVGRSVLVGKPVALLLLERHATVVMCHSRTRNLGEEISRAEVLVAAVGQPEMVKGEWIREGAIVIDVGINRTSGKLVGDVEYEPAHQRAAFITPVPGGVGPMTVAMLMNNTVLATKRTIVAEGTS